MTVSEKIKTIDNKIEQNKVQYNLDRQNANTSALSSGNVSKYEFLTSKDVLPEKDLLEKAAAIKRFENLPLGSELKKETSAVEKHYQVLNKLFESDKEKQLVVIKKEPLTIKKEKLEITGKSKLMYDSKYSFSGYINIRKYYVLSFMTKYNKLFPFYH